MSSVYCKIGKKNDKKILQKKKKKRILKLNKEKTNFFLQIVEQIEFSFKPNL